MNARIQPISNVSARARRALVQELGVADTIRFLNQFRAGGGDYTAERETNSTDESVASVIAQIKANRKA